MDSKPILKYIPIAEYDIGICYYGNHGKPYKITTVKADCKYDAMCKGATLLNPGVTETICLVETRPNPEYRARHPL